MSADSTPLTSPATPSEALGSSAATEDAQQHSNAPTPTEKDASETVQDVEEAAPEASGASDAATVIGDEDSGEGTTTSTAARTGDAKTTPREEENEDKLERFACHICLEIPNEPVVTLCGHLHCWPCMHEWLVTSRGRACPVCKAVLSVEQLVPIYTTAEAVDPRSRPIPPRPRPADPPPSAPFFRAPAFRNPFAALDAANMGGIDASSSSSSSFSFQAGVFPLPGLSFGWSWPPTPAPIPRMTVGIDEVIVQDEATGQQRVGVMMRDPHAVNRPPTREEWMRSVMQQVFLAIFFAMFVAITFGG
ncbi:hypothetical protein JCM10908_003294 [Rhodotorula pacifica]|uniref:uncharacterized protein n=1 Tax=Rhodotorula pacifica TaxID=1495444 RepID=UPI0031776B92